MNRTIALAFLASGLMGIAGCSQEKGASFSAGQAVASVGQDFALQSVSVSFPPDKTAEFPAGAGADAINNNCRACHSPAMILTQPPLKHEEWVKEIDKMRTTFKAPVNDADVPAILTYLDNLSARQNEGSLAAPGAAATTK